MDHDRPIRIRYVSRYGRPGVGPYTDFQPYTDVKLLLSKQDGPQTKGVYMYKEYVGMLICLTGCENIDELVANHRERCVANVGRPLASWLADELTNGENDPNYTGVFDSTEPTQAICEVNIKIPYPTEREEIDTILCAAPPNAVVLYNTSWRTVITTLSDELLLVLLFYGAYFHEDAWEYACSRVSWLLAELLRSQGI